jgi:class 3 adenylate cyclase
MALMANHYPLEEREACSLPLPLDQDRQLAGRSVAKSTPWLPNSGFAERPGPPLLDFAARFEPQPWKTRSTMELESLMGSLGLRRSRAEMRPASNDQESDGSAEEDIGRKLVTLLFTDIVGSTRTIASIGDRAWGRLLRQHHSLVRGELARFRGLEVEVRGDGFLASFDRPNRAIRCARSILDGVRCLGVDLRVGLHAGECEVIQGQLEGISVHIGARVLAHARPGEILVSRTVRELLIGSSLSFSDRGLAMLKGVPGRWRLFAVNP